MPKLFVPKTESNLALTLVQPNTLVQQIALVVAGAAVTAICAQITIPLEPVPVTLQTFAVLLCGVMLGPKLSPLSQLLYLGAGICGTPIFATALSGPHTLFGPTGGYLLSFPIAAALLGWFSSKGWDRKVGTLLVAMALAQVLILGCGAAWLALFVGGLGNAWHLGVQPFLLVEAAKALLIVFLMPLAWKVKEGNRGLGPTN